MFFGELVLEMLELLVDWKAVLKVSGEELAVNCWIKWLKMAMVEVELVLAKELGLDSKVK